MFEKLTDAELEEHYEAIRKHLDEGITQIRSNIAEAERAKDQMALSIEYLREIIDKGQEIYKEMQRRGLVKTSV